MRDERGEEPEDQIGAQVGTARYAALDKREGAAQHDERSEEAGDRGHARFDTLTGPECKRCSRRTREPDAVDARLQVGKGPRGCHPQYQQDFAAPTLARSRSAAPRGRSASCAPASAGSERGRRSDRAPPWRAPSLAASGSTVCEIVLARTKFGPTGVQNPQCRSSKIRCPTLLCNFAGMIGLGRGDRI